MPLTRRHIAIVLPDLRGGGVERVRLLLAEEFVSIGHKVTFVLFRAEGVLLSEVPEPCEVVNLRANRIRSALLPLSQYIRKARPDAVIAAMVPATIIAAIAHMITGSDSRLLLSEHMDLCHSAVMRGPSGRLLELLGSLIYFRAHSVVAVSDGVGSSMVEKFRIPANRIHVIHNPVRVLTGGEAYSSGDLDLIDWWQKCDYPLIAIGSLTVRKDFETLLDAVALLPTSISWRLVILGDGEERVKLREKTDRLGLKSNVRMPGFRANPYPFLKMARLFILSSRSEGLGNVIIEALSCGIPVVSTNCPSGPSEILSNGRYGRLVPVGKPDALAAGILSEFNELRPSDELRRRAVDFLPKIIAQQYLNVLFPFGDASAASSAGPAFEHPEK